MSDFPALVTRGEALASGLKTYFTGVPCRRGHVSKRRAASTKCLACDAESQASLREKKGGNCKVYAKKWREANKEKSAARERLRCRFKASEKAIKARHPDKPCVPKWLTRSQKDEIDFIYATAKDATLLSGDKHEVDHVIPIAGENVCGLHVPWNLQVLPMEMNRAKRNKVEA